MKLGCSGLGRTAYDLLFVLIRLTVIGDQGQINRNVEITLAFPDTWMELFAKNSVQSLLQTGSVWQRHGRTSRKRLPEGAFCHSRQAASILKRCMLAYTNTYRMFSAAIRVLRNCNGKFFRTTSTKAFSTCSERIVRVILVVGLDMVLGFLGRSQVNHIQALS